MLKFFKQFFWDFPIGLIERATQKDTSGLLVITHMAVWVLLAGLLGGGVGCGFYYTAVLLSQGGIWPSVLIGAALFGITLGPLAAGFAAGSIGPIGS